MATEELGVAELGVFFLGGGVEDGACHQRWLGKPGNAPRLPCAQTLPGIPVWDLHCAAFSGKQTQGNPSGGGMLFLNLPLGRGPEMQ